MFARLALAGAVLTACGGSDAPTNDLPAGITQVSSTAYPATAVGKGDTAATHSTAPTHNTVTVTVAGRKRRTFIGWTNFQLLSCDRPSTRHTRNTTVGLASSR